MATPQSPPVTAPRSSRVRFTVAGLATACALGLGAALLPAPAMAAPVPTWTNTAENLRKGDSGVQVSALQERLFELGYWIDDIDGEYGLHTVHAVTALQKAAGIARDGIVGPDTRAALDAGTVPEATTTEGDVVEIDLDTQLLMVVSDGEVVGVVHTSTGSGNPYEGSDGRHRIATTPTGTYEVFRHVDAWDPGPYGALYRPMYFNGGIAVHGYTSVPAVPASKGCARVSLAAMDWLWEGGHMDVHTTVLVR